MVKNRIYGFSLLEISIVLVLITLVAGMSISAGKIAIDSAKVASTNNRIATIEAALMAYRLANNRIPCPSDGATLSTNASYGIEAGTAGDCTTASATLYKKTVGGVTNGVVEGVIPVRTLSLPDEFMYDGWGRKFGYAASVQMTGINAFLNYGVSTNCGLITIGGIGGTRSSKAAYVLLSYGANGHGGFDPYGHRVNAGSTNNNEHTNCHCTNTGADTGAYAATYIAQDNSQNPADSNDNFDDVVRYKERWQMHDLYDEYHPKGNQSCTGTQHGYITAGNGDWNSPLGVDWPSALEAVDINGDGIKDVAIGLTNRGVQVIYGSAGTIASPLDYSLVGGVTSLSAAQGFTIVSNNNGWYVGNALVGCDFNGDGIDDLIIGTGSIAFSAWGGIYIVYGGQNYGSQINTTAIKNTMGATITAPTTDYVAALGCADINGDGKADIIIGKSSFNYTGTVDSVGDLTKDGKIYVVYGSSTMTSANPYTLDNNGVTGLLDAAGTKGFVITRSSADRVGSRFGLSIAVGDVNGDGINDIIIGAPYDNPGGFHAPTDNAGGRVYVLYGHKGSFGTSIDVDTQLNGNNGFQITERTGAYANNDSSFGFSLAVGDVNGDGIKDIIIDAEEYNTGAGPGELFVLFGKTAKWPKAIDVSTYMDGTRGTAIDGVAGDGTMYIIRSADVNGDGIDDILVGNPASGAWKGSVIAIFGKRTAWAASGTVNGYADGTRGFRLDGHTVGDGAGEYLATGDVTGEGLADILIGPDIFGNTNDVWVYYDQKQSSYVTPYDLNGLR